MKDHIWLLDYRTLFENKKYLIKVCQINAEDGAGAQEISDQVAEIKSNFNRKFDHLANTLTQKMLL